MTSEILAVSGQHANAPVDLHAMAQIKSIRRWHRASVAFASALVLTAISMPAFIFFDGMKPWLWVFFALVILLAGFIGLWMLGFEPLDESGLRAMKDLIDGGDYVKGIDKKPSCKGKVLRCRDLDRARAAKRDRLQAENIVSYVQSIRRTAEQQGDAK